MVRVEWLIWLITGRCNLNCKHCYASQYRGEVELGTRDVIRVLNDAYAEGVEHVNFTGGEPILRKDMFKILEECKNIGLSSSLFTNSTIIDVKDAEKFSKLEIPIYTSIEGPTREIHEKIRGRNSWDKALRGIKLLREYDIPFHINITITSLNWSFAGETLEKAVMLGANSVSIIPSMPAGNSLKYRITPTLYEYNHALTDAYLKARELGVEFRAWCTPFAPKTLRLEHIRYSTCRDWGVADVSPSGDILLCDVLGVRLANVKSGFRSAWETAINSKMYREAINTPIPLECRGCEISRICRGGCYARCYLSRGSFEGPDPLCPRFEDTPIY